MSRLLRPQLLCLLLLALIYACQKDLNDQTEEETDETASDVSKAHYISRVRPFLARKGEEISIFGANFADTMTLTLNRSPVSYVRISESELKATMPSLSKSGEVELALTQGENEVTYSLYYSGPGDEISQFAIADSVVCLGEKFYDANGSEKIGTRSCQSEAAPPNCSTDSQIGCTTTSSFPSVDKAQLDPWNIRIGKTVVGIAGALKTNCRNRANSTIFNSDTMPPGNTSTTAGTNLDWWDTVDDFNSNAVIPSSLISGWGADTDCYQSVWKDLTADGTCNSQAEDCVMLDRISGLSWSESYPATGAAASTNFVNWSTAVQRCSALSYGGFDDWRLPTQKELMEAYVHGLRGLGYNLSGTIRGTSSLDNNIDFIADTDINIWSSTTDTMAGTTLALYVDIYNGRVASLNKANNGGVLCVRP